MSTICISDSQTSHESLFREDFLPARRLLGRCLRACREFCQFNAMQDADGMNRSLSIFIQTQRDFFVSLQNCLQSFTEMSKIFLYEASQDQAQKMSKDLSHATHTLLEANSEYVISFGKGYAQAFHESSNV